jgi:hypothetical protein
VPGMVGQHHQSKVVLEAGDDIVHVHFLVLNIVPAAAVRTHDLDELIPCLRRI